MNGHRGVPPGASDKPSLPVPPYDPEAERGVLASILLNQDAVNPVLEVLLPEDFHVGAHRIVFEAMVDLHERQRPIDHVTLLGALRDRGVDEQVGGITFLSDLLQTSVLSDNAGAYARLVKDKAVVRKMIGAAQEIAQEAYQGVANLDEYLDRSEQKIFAVAESKARKQFASLKELVGGVMDRFQEAMEHKKAITGVPTGFHDLDRVTAGFQPKSLVIVAARPGMGKTSFCLNAALHAALHEGKPVLFFSLEMGAEELAARLVCSEARINSHRLKQGTLNAEEISRLTKAFGKLSQAPVYIDDSSVSALEIRAKSRRMVKEKKVEMVVVDYLQLMSGSVRRNSDNRVQEISEISRSLKLLAKELDVPIVALSQLSRAVEGRQVKKPVMSDLRESGAIEQDADLILFIYRESEYNKEMDDKGKAEILIAKHRSGETRDIELVWNGQYTRFDNLARHYE